MKNTTNDLPLELQAFASLLDAQPPEVQEAFQFVLTRVMYEEGTKAVAEQSRAIGLMSEFGTRDGGGGGVVLTRI